MVKNAPATPNYFSRQPTRRAAMETPTPTEQPERIPMMQQILDNPFLLLFLGVTIPTVLYLIWGVMEVASIPIAN
jgi:hypothetical protein